MHQEKGRNLLLEEFNRTQDLLNKGILSKDYAEGRKAGLNVASILLFQQGLGKNFNHSQGLI